MGMTSSGNAGSLLELVRRAQQERMAPTPETDPFTRTLPTQQYSYEAVPYQPRYQSAPMQMPVEAPAGMINDASLMQILGILNQPRQQEAQIAPMLLGSGLEYQESYPEFGFGFAPTVKEYRAPKQSLVNQVGSAFGLGGSGDGGGDDGSAAAAAAAADADAAASAASGAAVGEGANADAGAAGGSADGDDGGSGDGGGGGGGGKIVCTAMNHAYGFGSFRNAIWLKYSKQHMTKAHEVGYHTLFLPLVDFGFKQGDGKLNILVRKFLESCARHRSLDVRAEMRGTKRDPVGRIYRSVLEPLCFAVGKFKGY